MTATVADDEVPPVSRPLSTRPVQRASADGAQQLRIAGGSKLIGTASVGGAKNAALPIMASALLTGEPCVIHNIPWIDDIDTLSRVLRSLGARVEFLPDHTVVVAADALSSTRAPADLVRKMRASFLVMGPLLARFGCAEAAQPGGCDIGIRPVNVDIEGFRDMGAAVVSSDEAYRVECDRLHGTEIYLDYPSHTGTENLLMAACLADGETVIKHASTEPEVVDLAQFLSSLGARIDGAGTSTIVVRGVSKLHGSEYTVMPDRLIAGTYVAAAAITGGDITVERIIPDHLDAVIYKLQKIGATVSVRDDSLRVCTQGPMHSVDIQAIHYPGFPTDLQAVFGALLTQAQGLSTIQERVFENRLGYADELKHMGAAIEVEGQTARVYGPTALHGAPIRALDVRAGAAVILAALAADGCSILSDAQVVSRGYEDLVEVLQGFGASISWAEPELPC
ncbi:MAG: UDP-N-acetylglucosamine 1-carboxyvinyltransferase [Betaproteobacteria bacterium]|nr:UDP-N-acetylglucosamine 1-carboxyvinyltransferase [Betaproteobacteria bacterium]